MEITGTIKKINDIEEVTERFKRRFVIVETIDSKKRKQLIKFQLLFQGVEIIDSFNIGDEVRVIFDITGKETINQNNETVVYNFLDVTNILGAPSSKINMNARSQKNNEELIVIKNKEDDDTLPF